MDLNTLKLSNKPLSDLASKITNREEKLRRSKNLNLKLKVHEKTPNFNEKQNNPQNLKPLRSEAYVKAKNLRALRRI